jgi:hypothetical protein
MPANAFLIDRMSGGMGDSPHGDAHGHAPLSSIEAGAGRAQRGQAPALIYLKNTSRHNVIQALRS